MEKGNFKVRCIDTAGKHDLYTLGKIYEVIDGSLNWDNGNKTSQCSHGKFENIDHLNRWLSATFELVNDIPQYIIINQQSNTVTASLKQGKEVVKTAKAKCSPDDKFEFEVGAKLAVERLLGDSLNADLVNTDTEVKAIKRPARVGEWVRIVSERITSNCYQNREIYQVAELSISGAGGCFIKTEKTHPCNCGAGTSYISLKEYVVLENYNPSEPVPTNPVPIDYSTIDYSKLDGAKLFEEIERRVKLYDSGQ